MAAITYEAAGPLGQSRKGRQKAGRKRHVLLIHDCDGSSFKDNFAKPITRSAVLADYRSHGKFSRLFPIAFGGHEIPYERDLLPGSSAAEQAAVNRPVGGSIPSWGANFPSEFLIAAL